MKIMLKIWLFGALGSIVLAQNRYESQHHIDDTLYDSDGSSYHPPITRSHHTRSYEPTSHEEAPENDPRHYQSLEQRYHPSEAEPYSRPQPQYHSLPQEAHYQQPEDPSYYRPQELVVYHRPQQNYQPSSLQHEDSYQDSTHYAQPDVNEEPKYENQEPKYVQEPRKSRHSGLPRPVPVDPKLPLYFTMYEKRVVQDPLDKYGKGPWRYLQYGHGITYGSKEPGKVFEKGYGYIRALGRDHCKLPENLCPPRDEKPFDYEGRREPYFGYRPH